MICHIWYLTISSLYHSSLDASGRLGAKPKEKQDRTKAAFMKAHLSKRNSKKPAIILASLCLAACVNWTDPTAMQTRQTADLCQAYYLYSGRVNISGLPIFILS